MGEIFDWVVNLPPWVWIALIVHVTILGADGDPVWSGSTAASPAQLPDAALTAMHPTVLYRWQVEAMNANGQRIAWSKPTPFRFEAGSGDSPQE